MSLLKNESKSWRSVPSPFYQDLEISRFCRNIVHSKNKYHEEKIYCIDLVCIGPKLNTMQYYKRHQEKRDQKIMFKSELQEFDERYDESDDSDCDSHPYEFCNCMDCNRAQRYNQEVQSHVMNNVRNIQNLGEIILIKILLQASLR